MLGSYLIQTPGRSILIFCFLLIFSVSFAQPKILERQIIVPDYSGSAKNLLDHIGEKENIVFAYSSKISLSYEVNFQKKQMTLEDFLEIVFKAKAIGYKVSGGKILLYPYKAHCYNPRWFT